MGTGSYPQPVIPAKAGIYSGSEVKTHAKVQRVSVMFSAFNQHDYEKILDEELTVSKEDLEEWAGQYITELWTKYPEYSDFIEHYKREISNTHDYK